MFRRRPLILPTRDLIDFAIATLASRVPEGDRPRGTFRAQPSTRTVAIPTDGARMIDDAPIKAARRASFPRAPSAATATKNAI